MGGGFTRENRRSEGSWREKGQTQVVSQDMGPMRPQDEPQMGRHPNASLHPVLSPSEYCLASVSSETTTVLLRHLTSFGHGTDQQTIVTATRNSQVPGGGGFGMGEIRNNKIWHNK